MGSSKWIDVGAAAELRNKPVARVEADGLALALSFADGARQLMSRGVAMAGLLLGQGEGVASTPRGGRKASPLRMGS